MASILEKYSKKNVLEKTSILEKYREPATPLLRSGSAAPALAKTGDIVDMIKQRDYLKKIKDYPIVPEQKKSIQSFLGEPTKQTIPTKGFSSMLKSSKEAKDKEFEALGPAEKQLQKQGVDLGQTIGEATGKEVKSLPFKMPTSLKEHGEYIKGLSDKPNILKGLVSSFAGLPEAQRQREEARASYLQAQDPKRAERAKPGLHYIGGLTFGHYAPDTKPVTGEQKIAFWAGRMTSAWLLGHFVTPQIASSFNDAIAYSPTMQEVVKKISEYAIQHPIAKFGIDRFRDFGIGAFRGSLEKAETRKEVFSNVLQFGGAYAAFGTILGISNLLTTQPLTPTGETGKLTFGDSTALGGKDIISKKAELSYLSKISGDGITKENLISGKELWFAHPKDPNVLARVTANTFEIQNPTNYGLVDTSGMPKLGEIDIKIFNKEPALYEKLTAFLSKGKQAIGEVINIAQEVPAGLSIQDVGQPAQPPVTPPSIVPTATGAEVVAPKNDQARIQEIKNSIEEGKLLLRAGVDKLGNELTTEQRFSIKKSVENAMAKIGEVSRVDKGYTIEDVTPAGFSPEPEPPKIVPEAVSEVKPTTIPDTLTKSIQEAKAKGLSAEEFLKGQGEATYHGTNQEFTEFKVMEGQDKKGVTSGEGVWLTKSADEAQQYADYSASRNVPDAMEHEAKVDKLLDEIAVAEKQGNWDLSAELTQQVEKMETDAMYGEPTGQRVVEAYPIIENPKTVDGSSITGNQAEIIAEAKKEGYDSVIFKDISDSPYEKITTDQIVVFDANKVKTKQQLTDIYNKAQAEVAEPAKIVPEVKADKPTEVLDKIYKDNAEKVEKALGQIWEEMTTSERGERIMTAEDTFIAKQSSFPKWLDPSLRSRTLFDDVVDDLFDIKEIKYDVANTAKVNKIYSSILDEVDKRVGINTEDIRNKIVELSDSNKEVSKLLKAEVQKLLKKAEAISRPATVTETKKAVAKIVSEPSKFIRKRETTLLKDRIKNIGKGALIGKRSATQEIQSIKEELSKAIKILPNEKQFKLISTLKNATTQKDLQISLDMVEKISKDIEKRVIINTIKDDIKTSVLKKLRPENKKAIEDVMADLDVAKLSDKKTIRLENLKQKIQENPNQLLSDERLRDLSRLSKTPLSDMEVRDIENIRDSIKHYLKLNETENKLIFGSNAEELNKYTSEAVENLNKKASAVKTDKNLIDTGIKQKSLSLRRKFFDIELQNAETLTEQLDRDKQGVIKKLIYDDIDKGTSKQLAVKQEMEDYLTEELKDIDIKNWSRALQSKEKKIDIQTIKLTGDKTIKLTKGDRISLELHSRNYNNLNHLLEGGFRSRGLITAKYRISQEDLDIIKNSMSPEEKKVADILSKVFKKLQPKINETSVNLDGFEIARVKEYYPITTAQIDRQRDALKLKGKFSQKTLEGMGILKERTTSQDPLILEDAFKTVYKHIEQVSSYIGLAEPLRNAKMLLGDNEFIENVINNYGNEYNKYLEQYLTDIEDQSYNVEGIDKFGLDLINRLDRAILSVNPGVILKQPLSYFTANTEVDYKYLQKALVTNPNKGVREMVKSSPQLRERMTGKISRELGELADAGAVRNFFLNESPLSGWLIKGIEFTDKKTVGYVWNAVKMEVADKYPDLKGDELTSKITERAEEVIRKTQPTYLIKDRSQAARRQTFIARVATRFQTQLNKNYNAGRRAVLEYDISGKTIKDKSNLLKTLAIITVINGIAVTVINNLKKKLYRKKAKEPIVNAVDFIGNSFSSVYGVGNLFYAISSEVERGSYGSFNPEDPLYAFGNSVADVIGETIRAVEQASKNELYKSGDKKGEAKWKDSVLRALDGSARIGTEAVAGLPYWNIKDIAKIITRDTEEETKPKGSVFGVPSTSNIKAPNIKAPKLPNLKLPKLPKF